MEIAIVTLSWIVTVLLVLLILSVPADLIISKVKKDWEGSRAAEIYQYVQMGALGAFILCLLIVVVLMTSTF